VVVIIPRVFDVRLRKKSFGVKNCDTHIERDLKGLKGKRKDEKEKSIIN
jgi:hypothetical protein